ncbi:MAG: alpha/beta fold hydrolase [Anaeromyxobacteraceae bacterium]
MPEVLLPASPVLPTGGPVRIHLRDRGAGPPVVFLHGGWGERAYPFDDAAAALAARHRVLVPDRAGYGRSTPLEALPAGFHRAMAGETLAILDALDLPRAALWGHSDGAVVAAWAALLAPDRVTGLVLEAVHVLKAKVGSLRFFEDGVEAPERYGAAALAAMEADHGPAWRHVCARGARAWLRIIDEGRRAGGDLYDGRLGELRCPVLAIHGARDPRTEPGELDALRAAVPHARVELLDTGHAPHASARVGARCTALAAEFLRGLPA